MSAPPTPPRTLEDLPEPQAVVESAELRTPKGRSIRVLVTHETDPYETAKPLAELAPTPLALAAQGDKFTGKARRAAKISIADAKMEKFDDLVDLIAALTPDAEMIDLDLSDGPTSKRVVAERRNVRVRTFLYAASREDDNDWHLIIGRRVGQTPRRCMNVEISGLPSPSSAAFKKIKRARDAFKKFFGDKLPGAGYQHYDPPIEVVVEGSLFFDVTHSTGPHPGPAKLRPFIPTIWEIHPVTRIVFEPE